MNVKIHLSMECFMQKIECVEDTKLKNELIELYSKDANDYCDYKTNIMKHTCDELVPITSYITNENLLECIQRIKPKAFVQQFIRRELYEMLQPNEQFMTSKKRMEALNDQHFLFLVKRFLIFFNDDAMNEMIHITKQLIYK